MIDLKAKPGCCEEAALGVPVPVYVPCNEPAVNIVGWKGRSDPPIRMCFACTDHNVRNRGGEVLRPFVAGEENAPPATIYTVSPCPCGHPACKDWHVSPVAALQGVKFTERQARAVAGLLNQMGEEP